MDKDKSEKENIDEYESYKGEKPPEETSQKEEPQAEEINEEKAEEVETPLEDEPLSEDSEKQEEQPEEEIYPAFEIEGENKFKAFFEVVSTVLMSPGQFFEKLNLTNGIGYPLIFGIIIYFINSLGGSGIYLVEVVLNLIAANHESAVAGLISAIVAPLVSLFIAPLTILLASVIYHIVLKVFNYDQNGFEGTVRLVCYSSAPLIIGIVPACGSFIGLIWSAVAMIVGLQTICRMSTGWAILIYLIPLIFFCSCLALVMGLGGFALVMTILPEIEQYTDVLLQEV